MPRRQTVTNAYLLDAARMIFLRDGFAASTVEIARAAGVSEGTVFKRFPTKSKLFQAAMGLPECKALRGVHARVGKGDIREEIRAVAGRLLAFYMELVPRLSVMLGAPTSGRVHDFIRGPDSPPRVLREELAAYLGAEQEAGRLGDAEPLLLAQVLLGTLHSYAFANHIGIAANGAAASQAFVDDLVEVLWAGIAPKGTEGRER